MAGKGDKRRPMTVSHKQFSINWNRIFDTRAKLGREIKTLQQPMTDEELDKNHRCAFDLDEEPCHKCKKNEGPCYFVSDGGYEPRDGTYYCKECLISLFVVCDNFALGISCECDECKSHQLALESEFEDAVVTCAVSSERERNCVAAKEDCLRKLRRKQASIQAWSLRCVFSLFQKTRSSQTVE